MKKFRIHQSKLSPSSSFHGHSIASKLLTNSSQENLKKLDKKNWLDNIEVASFGEWMRRNFHVFLLRLSASSSTGSIFRKLTFPSKVTEVNDLPVDALPLVASAD